MPLFFPICLHSYKAFPNKPKWVFYNIIYSPFLAQVVLDKEGLILNRLNKAINLANNKNVFLETSGNTYPLVDYATKKLDSKKIILGSDFPHEHPFISTKIIELLDISEQEKDQILYKNILRILEI